MAWLGLVLLWIVGCGRSVDCADPASSLAEAQGETLTCHEAGWALAWMEVLAGRSVPRADRRIALSAVRSRFERDPAATRAWLQELRTEASLLGSMGLGDGAEARSRQVYAASTGEGMIRAEHGSLDEVQRRTLAVWSSDDDRKLAFTEADIEGWIRYASLCREVQQAGPLRISVADRVSVYRVLRERFDQGTRAEQVALSSMGPLWRSASNAWQAAPFPRQQAFTKSAPLPAPMTGTSLDYARAVFSEDVVQHTVALRDALGPFTVGRGGPMLSAEVPEP